MLLVNYVTLQVNANYTLLNQAYPLNYIILKFIFLKSKVSPIKIMNITTYASNIEIRAIERKNSLKKIILRKFLNLFICFLFNWK